MKVVKVRNTVKITPFHSPQRRAFIAAFVLLGLFYVWTCFSDGVSWKFGTEQPDYYNRLVHGFMQGRLSLEEEVPQALVECANPYDPALRPAGVGLHDASYYRGRYYIYYGVVPALVLLLPFRLASGVDLPVAAAVLGLLLGAYAVLLVLVADLRRRFFGRSGAWTCFAIAAALGFANWAPVLLRRHSMYELPIACGQFFALAAVYALYRTITDAVRPLGWLTLGSFCWGLAIGSRPTYLLAPASLVVLAFVLPSLRRRQPVSSSRIILWLAALGPVVLVGVGLAAYNQVRFGNPLEFGVSYILSGVHEADIRHFALQYFPWNLRAYLLAPGAWSFWFPFYHELPLLAARPGQHFGLDLSFGLLPQLPFLWFAALTPLVFVWRAKEAGGAQLRLLLGLLFWVGLSVSLFLLCFYAAMIRYVGDFGVWFGLLAALGALAFADGMERRGAGWLGAIPVQAAAALTAVLVGLFSLGAYGSLRQLNPVLYSRVAALANRPALWFQSVRGAAPEGALLLSVRFSDGIPAGGTEELLALGWGKTRDRICLLYPDSTHVQFSFQREGGVREDGPPVALDRTRSHELRISLGSLYHPLGRVPFSELSTQTTQALFRRVLVEFDGKSALDRYQRFDDEGICPFSVGGLAGNSAAGVQVESVSREPLAVTLARAAEQAGAVAGASCAPDSGGWVRLSLAFPAAREGTREPLLVSGETGRGDFLLVEYLGGGRLRFQFDHWGKSPYLGPVFEYEPGREYALDIQYPSPLYNPRAGVLGETRRLVLSVDGHVLWEAAPRAYPAEAEDFFAGRNPLGGSSCGQAFSGTMRLRRP